MSTTEIDGFPTLFPYRTCLVAQTYAHRPSHATLTVLPMQPHVKQYYLLGLSILIKRAKETYKDSLSNGEQTRNILAWESGAFTRFPHCSLEKCPQRRTRPKYPKRGCRRRWGPCHAWALSPHKALLASQVVWACNPNQAVNSVQG